jgi:hypothetical protein
MLFEAAFAEIESPASSTNLPVKTEAATAEGMTTSLIKNFVEPSLDFVEVTVTVVESTLLLFATCAIKIMPEVKEGQVYNVVFAVVNE